MDTDLNGKYDFLELEINVDATSPDFFSLTVELYDDTNSTFIAGASVFTFLDGPSTIFVDLSGQEIRASGIDGPYRADLFLFDDASSLHDYDEHSTGIYLATDFDETPAKFAPPHADSVSDTDLDGLHNTLTVTASVDVSQGGFYYLIASLYDPVGSFIASESATASLTPGIQPFAVEFVGWQIFQHGVDGPYDADLSLYDSSFAFLDSDTHTTDAYLYTDFEMPPLEFAPPHTDSGFDEGTDGLFDFLRVSVSVDVFEAGTYRFGANLRDSFGIPVDFTDVTRVLSPGLQTVPIDFLGWLIYKNGVDGPYTVTLEALDQDFNLLDTDAHSTVGYLYTEFERPPVQFAPPHSDAVLDTDFDGLHNLLEVTAHVDIGQAGTYRIVGALYDSISEFIDTADIEVTLEPGSSQSVALNFPGWIIREHGVDGPFEVVMEALDTSFNLIDSDTHTTDAYAALNFDMPPAAFAPPHLDEGVDSDLDGLFEAISVEVRIQVEDAGDYLLTASLWDATLTVPLGFDFASTFLSAGDQSVFLEFATIPMVSGGINGPYVAQISLVSPAVGFLDSGSHLTAPYTVLEFEPLPAEFAPPHTDVGIDRDLPPDVEYNVLEVDVSIDVLDSGFFGVAGLLLDSTASVLIASDIWVGTLSPGLQTVPLVFSGVAIRDSGIDGPYAVNLTLLALVAGAAFLLDSDLHTTGPYLATDFQSVTPATLSGTISDEETGSGIPFASVDAVNALNGFAVEAQADPSGNYALGLYDGEWIVLYDDFAAQAKVERITVLGSTVNDVSLEDTRPVASDAALTFATWNEADLFATLRFEPDNATIRLFIDWFYGDQDGVLSQAEFDIFLAAVGFSPPPLSGTSEDMFRVDGTYFNLVPGSSSWAWLDVAGPVDAPIPFTGELGASYASSTPIPPTPSHLVELNVGYDTPSRTQSFVITFPGPYSLEGFSSTPAVSIAGIGTDTVTVDPGMDPDPSDSEFSEWVSLIAQSSDATAPTIGSAVASPDPVALDSATTITAAVSDDSGVASVSVEIRNPAGGVIGRFSMTDQGGGTYSYTYTTADLGTYTFTVLVSDSSGNTASRSGSFNSVDLAPPTITSATDTPDPAEAGQLAVFAASVTDNDAVASVTVEVKDSTGAIVGNFTMSYNAASGRYEASRSFTTLGTHTYTVWARDPSGNVASTGGTLVVRDTTRPTVSAGPDQTVAEGTTVTLSAIASDAVGVASYTWTFTDNGAKTLTGVNPTYRFDNPGTFTVTLTVGDTSGNTATDIVVITVTATTGTIQGTVIGPSGQAISGATVRLLSGTTEVASTTTDANGHFEFTDVAPGSYTVRIEATSYESKSTEVTVSVGAAATASVQLVALSVGGILGLGWEVWGVVIVAVIAIAAAAVVLRRRRSRPPA